MISWAERVGDLFGSESSISKQGAWIEIAGKVIRLRMNFSDTGSVEKP